MALSATGCNKRLRHSMMNLPTPIVVDILLQLSGESIVFCKCTCKFLHGIVSDPQFSKLYFARAARSDVYPMVRPIGYSLFSRTLYLVDPRLYMFENSSKMKLETTFKIPLHNFEKVLDSVKLKQGQSGIKRKQCLALNPKDHKFDIVNSCNGFICLSRKDLVVVCNPVTGEFVSLPVPPMPLYKESCVRYAFGFCPSTNSYKVIRLFDSTMEKWSLNCPLTEYPDKYSSFVQIQKLGSRSWKNIGPGPCYSGLSYNTFYRGTLNWIYRCWSGLNLVASFDFVNDQFGSFSLPPCGAALPINATTIKYNFSLGVLWDCLGIFNASTYGNLEISVMREYGVERSWTKVCNVGLQRQLSVGPYDIYAPITGLENGAILMFHYRNRTKCGLIYFEPETQRLRYSSVKGITGGYEAIGFTPSFNLLKDVLVGSEVEVLNVKSRCANFNIRRDTGTPYLLQESSA